MDLPLFVGGFLWLKSELLFSFTEICSDQGWLQHIKPREALSSGWCLLMFVDGQHRSFSFYVTWLRDQVLATDSITTIAMKLLWLLLYYYYLNATITSAAAAATITTASITTAPMLLLVLVPQLLCFGTTSSCCCPLTAVSTEPGKETL